MVMMVVMIAMYGHETYLNPYLKLFNILGDVLDEVLRSFLNLIKQPFIFVEFLIYCLKIKRAQYLWFGIKINTYCTLH